MTTTALMVAVLASVVVTLLVSTIRNRAMMRELRNLQIELSGKRYALDATNVEGTIRQLRRSLDALRANPKVTLVYPHARRMFAERLCSDLGRQGVEVWWDEEHLRVGDDIREALDRAMGSSQFVVAVLAPDSSRSEWVKKELEKALKVESEKARVFVLPVLVEPTELPSFLKHRKYADFSSDYGQGLAELLAGIRGSVRSSDTSEDSEVQAPKEPGGSTEAQTRAGEADERKSSAAGADHADQKRTSQ